MATNNLSLLRNFLNTLPNNSIYSLAINGIGKNDINASYLFNNYQNLNKITSLNITYNVTNMSSMFYSCYNLLQYRISILIMLLICVICFMIVAA